MGFPDNKDSVTKGVDTAALTIRSFFKGSMLQKIIIIDALVIALFNRDILKWITENLGIQVSLPPIYNTILWVVVITLFIVAVFLRYRELAIYPPAPPVVLDSSPIKGPLSFQPSDAELFKRLQRNNEIQIYKNAITQQGYKIGILTAVSGCGKSSLLNAGLVPSLQSINIACVIVTFTNKPPIESILEAIKEQLGIADIDANQQLYQLLSEVLGKTGKPSLLLIFDQFEQFFTQNPLAINRESFILQLKEIYDKAAGIKLLVSIRSDFLDYVHEIQEKLQYTLDATRNYFTLKKFTVQQVVAIFMVIAEAEQIENRDITFLEKLSKEELASKQDGLISPVDIQIIALVIKSNKDNNTAFNERAFGLFGGIEGLLRKYIDDQLNTPNLFKKDVVLNILMALIDTNKNVRAGQLTEEEIKDKMVSDSGMSVTKVLGWLEGVRLIHKIGNNPARYELAHELLIVPTLKIVDDSSLGVRKVNYLLERRSDEWIINNRSRRYLFSLKELWQINHYKKLISWGNKEAIKKQLVSASIINFRNWVFSFLGVFILFIVVLAWRDSEGHKISLLRNEIVENIENNIKDGKEKNEAIDSLASIDIVLALQVAKKITNESYKAEAYSTIAEKMSDKKQSDSIFSLALQVADSITVESYKAEAYSTIAQKMSDKNPTLALQVADNITVKSYKARAYSTIAQKMSDKNPTLALQVAEKITVESNKAEAYSTIAEKMSDKNPTLALQVADSITVEFYKARVYSTIAEKMSDKKQSDSIFSLALQVADSITYEFYKAEAYSTIAEKMSDKNPTLALQVADNITGELYKASAYIAIAEKMSDKNPTLDLLQVDSITVEFYKARAYSAIAEKMSDKKQSDSIFSLALQVADKITYESFKASAYYAIAEKMSDKKQSDSIFSLALQVADKIIDESYKAEAYYAIAEKMSDKKQSDSIFSLALQAADKIIDESYKAEAYYTIAEKMSDKKQSDSIFSLALQAADKITNEARRVNICNELIKTFEGKTGTRSDLEKKTFIKQLKTAKLNYDESKVVMAKIYQKLEHFKKSYFVLAELKILPYEKTLLYIDLYKKWSKYNNKSKNF